METSPSCTMKGRDANNGGYRHGRLGASPAARAIQQVA
jgi:hypothetical protein